MSDDSGESSDSNTSTSSVGSGSIYKVESSDASSTCGDSDSSMGRGQRLKKRKRHDDSLATELEEKVKAKKVVKSNAGKKKAKTSKTAKSKTVYKKPVRIEKAEDRKPSKAPVAQRLVNIEQAKQLAAIQSKAPVTSDMITLKPSTKQNSTPVLQVQQSPDKEFYKRKLAELMAIQANQAGTSKDCVPLSVKVESPSSLDLLRSKHVSMSDSLSNVLDRTIFASTSSLRKSDEVVAAPLHSTNDYEQEPLESSGNSFSLIYEEEQDEEELLTKVEPAAEKIEPAAEKIEPAAEKIEPAAKKVEPVKKAELDHLQVKFIDGKAQLLFCKDDDDVKELRKDSGIYVKRRTLDLLQNSKSHTGLARNLMDAVFTVEALCHCSLKGKLAKGPLGKPQEQRNALHPAGVKAILDYSRRFCEKRQIQVRDEPYVRKQMGTHQSEIRSSVREVAPK